MKGFYNPDRNIGYPPKYLRPTCKKYFSEPRRSFAPPLAGLLLLAAVAGMLLTRRAAPGFGSASSAAMFDTSIFEVAKDTAAHSMYHRLTKNTDGSKL